jgi:hypothetical protein
MWKEWQLRTIQAINEGENRYRQLVLGQGPLPGMPVIAKESSKQTRNGDHANTAAEG